MSEHDPTETTSAAFFEKKYRDGADPWNFTGSAYEQARYTATMQALNGRRYRKGFEPGCSIGILSEKLIEVCDSLESIDFAPSAIETAKRRRTQSNIDFRVIGLPERLPLHGFDLIVLSEIGYYFTAGQWEAMVQSMVDTAAPGTTFLAVHWTGVSPDHQMDGDMVHAILRAQSRLHLQHEERHAGFRLDRWERSDDGFAASS